MNNKQDLPNKIKILMLKKGKGIDDLMRHFNVTQPAISNAINGKRISLQQEIYNYLKNL